MEKLSVMAAGSTKVCHVCQCTSCGKCDNGFGCCDVCSQNCDCTGCGFQLGKATGDDNLKMKQTKLATSYAMVKSMHLRFVKSATFNEHRNYLKGKVQQCIKSREKDHYWTYDWKVGDSDNMIKCCRVSYNKFIFFICVVKLQYIFYCYL